jgi:hypothetical protein
MQLEAPYEHTITTRSYINVTKGQTLKHVAAEPTVNLARRIWVRIADTT